MMIRRTRRDPYRSALGLLIGIAVVALSVSCARMQNQDKMDKLDLATRTYGKAIRWSHFDSAEAFLSPESPRLTEAEREALEKGIRVTSYEPAEQVMTPDLIRTTISVKIAYLLDGSNRLRTITDRQNWRYDEEAKRWYLEGSLPDFTE